MARQARCGGESPEKQKARQVPGDAARHAERPCGQMQLDRVEDRDKGKLGDRRDYERRREDTKNFLHDRKMLTAPGPVGLTHVNPLVRSTRQRRYFCAALPG